MIKRIFFPFLFLVLILAACTPGNGEPVTREPAATATSAESIAADPIPTNTSTPTLQPAATPTPTPNLTPFTPPATPPTPTPAPPFPGFRYETADGTWQVDANWQPHLLVERTGVVLSPDSRQSVYIEEGDIWLLDNASGETTNLTAESTRTHCCLQWPAERPDLLIFGSWAAEDFSPSTGHLTIMNLDGSGYQVLVDGESGALPDISPDGQQIAYDTSGAAWLYDLTAATSSRLDPAEYGVENVQRIGGPSWSPDGSRIAWTIAIANPDWRIAVVVFDLAANTAQLFHTYENIGRGGWFPGPAWHPDGDWLAFVAEDVNPEKFGVWAINTRTGEETQIGWGQNPLWSPDRRWLAYSEFDSNDGSAPPTWIVEVGSWYHVNLFIPDNGRLLDWVAP